MTDRQGDPERHREQQQPQGRQPQQPSQQGQQQPGQQPPQQQSQQPSRYQPGQQLGQPQLEPITVEDIIEADVETVDPNTPIATAAAKMETAGVGSVVITDENNHPTGILTDRKIALALEEMPDVGERESQELASGEMITADTDTDVFEAIGQLGEASIRRLPIVDENGELAGIVTLDDILVLLVTELESAVGVIEDQSPRY